ncbi:STAS domain-containing protein [Paludisphaera borealis]|uniref:Anti-sigma-B factor antagonist n=1 Tax=Paludisphaera borealis TaxID=1387353 RepID=A0A1U7CJF1_9BACT|nr:STAS domain-containing protein [Paludisphaera borealis]APW59064.1 anti-sigma-B factor antagonist [Paludisphaera borealis]MDR3622584.1 STAS domain-containing protein [Paludisphaera borealis]
MLNFTTSEVSDVMIINFEPTEEENYDWQLSQRDWLYKLLESREDGRFAIDLTDVNYLASSEIGFLVTIKRRIDRRKGQTVIYGVSPYIMDIFRTMNLHKVLDIVENRAAALAKLKS